MPGYKHKASGDQYRRKGYGRDQPGNSSTPALSIRQPWAWAIVAAGKDVENRSRATPHRGPLFVHASKTLHGPTWRRDARALVGILASLGGKRIALRVPEPEDLPFGAFVGVCEVVGCEKTPQLTPNPWADPQWFGWALSGARALAAPIPASGALGLWYPTLAEADAIAAGIEPAPASCKR